MTAPTISSATLVGSTLTIGGSNFGLKTTAAPLQFNNFESSTVGDLITTLGYTVDTVGAQIPTIQNDRAHSGTKSVRMDYPIVAADAGTFPECRLEGVDANEVYVAVWMYWAQPIAANSGIFKLCRAGTNPVYSGRPQANGTIFTNTTNGLVDQNDYSYVPTSGPVYQPSTQGDRFPGPNLDRDVWRFYEFSYRLSTPGVSDGFFKTWVNGYSEIDLTGPTRDVGDAGKNINWITNVFNGLDGGSTGAAAMQVWQDELYQDTSISRVVITDNATYASSTKFAVQPPSTWATGVITNTNFNQSDFANGATGYVFVTNSGGETNTTGFPFTIGASTFQPAWAINCNQVIA